MEVSPIRWVQSWLKELKPSSCVGLVSYDFSMDVLLQLGWSETVVLMLDFEKLLPHDPWVKKFLIEHQTSITLDELLMFITHCLNNADVLDCINILAFVSPDLNSAINVQKGLLSQKWVAGVKICPHDLLNTYIYLLEGLNNYIIAKREYSELTNRFWIMSHAITLGPSEPYDYEPTEPMNQATRIAAKEGYLILVAAGNEAKIVSGNSLNPWSVAPWVIGVGATNAAGTKLLEDSSRGTLEDPNLGPNIVAPGVAESWAMALGHGHTTALRAIELAPPQTVVTAQVGKGFFQYSKDRTGKTTVNIFYRLDEGEAIGSVPIEEFRSQLEETFQEQAKELKGTSFATEYITSVCFFIAQKVKEMRNNIPKQDRPKLIKTLLEDMAQPLKGYDQWEQGSGVVTWEIAESYMARLGNGDVDKLYERAVTQW